MMFVTKEFSVEDLENMLWGDSDTLKEVKRNFVEKHRWFNSIDIIFLDKETGFYYSAPYMEPASEMQDGQERWDGDPVECLRVEPVEEKIIVYKPVEA